MATLKWLKNKGNYYYFNEAPVHVSSISLNKNSIALTEAGQTAQLAATISPSTGVVETSIYWHSSDTNIAIVDNSGLVTCVTPGECTITATCDGISASCSVI